jgi:hypothetical protein
MSLNLAIALLFNTVLILLVSWGFFLYALRQHGKNNQRLESQVRALQKKLKQSRTELEQERQIPAPQSSDQAIAGFARGLQATASTLNTIEGVARQQSGSLDCIEQASAALKPDDHSRELMVQLSTLKAQFAESEQLIARMKTQASNNRHQLKVLEEKLERQSDQSRRIKGLEDQERRLRREIKLLTQGAEERDEKLRRMGRTQKENTQLRAKISEYFAKNKRSEELVKELQQRLNAAQRTAEETRQALEQLQTQPPINPSDFELGELKEALERTLREKQFIEEQYLELLDQVETADDVAEQLQRSQKECAMLEQSYLQLIEELEKDDEAQGSNEDFKLEEISMDE